MRRSRWRGASAGYFPYGGYGISMGDYGAQIGYGAMVGAPVAGGLANLLNFSNPGVPGMGPVPMLQQIPGPAAQAYTPPFQGVPVVAGFGQGQVIQQPPMELGGGILGFESDSLDQNDEQTLAEHSQNDFRPESFSVDESSLTFTLKSLLVGTENQILNSKPIPASSFAAKAFDRRLKMKTVNRGQDISFIVTQIDAEASIFRAACFGTQLK